MFNILFRFVRAFAYLSTGKSGGTYKVNLIYINCNGPISANGSDPRSDLYKPFLIQPLVKFV